MATLILNSTDLPTLALVMTLALAAPARAADVSLKLDAGTGFAVKNSTGAIERLRVDEATGNVSRNGALFVHTTGSSNLFVGPFAGNLAATASSFSAAFGYSALNSLTTGASNSAFGNAALRSNTTGSSNTAVGRSALYYNTTGSNNTAVGNLALGNNTTGSRNSGIGKGALKSNTTGFGNSALGESALSANTTGFSNVAFGASALRDNTAGNSNSALGYAALQSNANGIYNSAVGDFALFANTSGTGNSAIGHQALDSNTTGKHNTAIGRQALDANTTGLYNSAVGFGALSGNTSGRSNIAIGRDAGALQTTGNDNIYLQNIGVAGESGTIRIGTGSPSIQTRAFVAGIRGITTGVADAIPVLIDSTGQLGTVSSSRSVKNDIRDMGDATARLLDLRPVTFRYNQQQTLPSGGAVPPEYGLIAEEVAEVFPDLVVYDEKGQPFTVKYHEMAPMLLNEMKKQQHTIEAQAGVIEAQRQAHEKQMQALRQEHEQEIAELETRLARVETRVGGATGERQR